MNFKKFRIPLLLLFAVLIIAGIVLIPKIKKALEFREAMEMGSIEHTFINMNEFLPAKNVSKTENPFVFAREKNISLPLDFEYQGKTYNSMEYMDSSYTQGLLVLQNDTIIYEDYWRGQQENVQHISWSVAKSYISALFGIAMEEGHIKSIHQTVDEYLPELKGSGYEGVTIKDVLEMSSGVGFDETYGAPDSDITKYWEGFMTGGSQDEFARTLKNEKPPGTYNHYVSINTHVLGMIIVRTTGQSIRDYFEEKIWKPLGAEFDAYWLADGHGMEMVLGGLNVCLRDYAKLGQLFLHKGNWNGKQIVPAKWIEESTHSTSEHLQPQSENSAHPGIGYGYQWWIPEGDEGEFMAIGVFNQFIYINPTTNTVIVKNSANQNFYDKENPYTQKLVHLELFRKIAHLK